MRPPMGIWDLARQRNLDLILLLALALFYRLYLSSIYFGWEESDYGNMAMAKGVLDSHFTHYDMRHLPLYYGLSAAVLAISGDAIIATRGVSMLAGLGVIALSYAIARDLFDRPVALLAGLLLVFQPEVALYSATALREPLYCALMLLGLFLMMRNSAFWAGLSIGGAFLTRFDAMFTGMPLLVFHHLSKNGPLSRRLSMALRALGVSAAIIASWSLYCGLMHGDFIFIRSTVEVNVATGGAQEVVKTSDFIAQGVETIWGLFTQTMTRKIGWPIWIGAWIALFLLAKRALRIHNLRTFLLSAMINSAFWLAVAFVAQHESNHNLYWKWMYILVPFWVILAAHTALYLWRMGSRYLSIPILGLSLALTIFAFTTETQAQLADSARLYGPQVRLARWIEAEVPPGTAMVLDNIPACYLDRQDHDYELHSWFDMQLPEGDPKALASYIRGFDLKYILWFKEDWTVAPRTAPYLALPKRHDLSDEISLEVLESDDAYGYIFYEVVRQ